tara:strand:- start:292 stop:591 length:300 start_codon:yes stop_codon:yes gene_type:complete
VDSEGLSTTADIIERLGLPVVGFLLIGYCFWKVIGWLKDSLTGKLNSQMDILVQLIDRIRVLQTDILKLDTMIRTRYGLDADEERISRADEPVRKKRNR